MFSGLCLVKWEEGVLFYEKYVETSHYDAMVNDYDYESIFFAKDFLRIKKIFLIFNLKIMIFMKREAM